MNRRISDTEKSFREELNAMYPGQALLDATEVGRILGFSLTHAKTWLETNECPYTITNLKAGGRGHRKYRKSDICRILADSTFSSPSNRKTPANAATLTEAKQIPPKAKAEI